MLSETIIINNGTANAVHGKPRYAGVAEASDAAAVILLAFAGDPVARWIYPSLSQYLEHFPKFIQAFAGRAFERRTALVTPDLGGAALWLPPGVGSDDRAVLDLMMSTTSPDIREDLLTVLEAMGEYHPDEPHWYLPMIGVQPDQQGLGLGGDLMRHALSRCDRDGLPAYLESSNPRNISLYKRCGFISLGTIQFGSSPPLFPMLRRPR